MAGRRQEREQQRRREALERAMDSGEPLEAALCFHDHADLVRGLGESLERAGLPEACQALARHLEEDRDHWLRRLARVEAELDQLGLHRDAGHAEPAGGLGLVALGELDGARAGHRHGVVVAGAAFGNHKVVTATDLVEVRRLGVRPARAGPDGFHLSGETSRVEIHRDGVDPFRHRPELDLTACLDFDRTDIRSEHLLGAGGYLHPDRHFVVEVHAGFLASVLDGPLQFSSIALDA